MVQVLAIDLGTQSLRATILRDDGRVSWQWARPVASRVAGEVFEQDPAEWAALLRDALREAAVSGMVPDAVAACGPLAGFVPLDDAGRVLGPAITYADRRPAAYVPRVLDAIGNDTADDPLRLRCYGADPLPNACHAMAQVPAATRLLDATGYLGHLLSGRSSLNAYTALRLYTPRVRDALQIPHGYFAPPVETGAIIGTLGGGGLAPPSWSHLPVVAVPFDSKCAYLASALKQLGDMAEISGTVTSIGVRADSAVDDPGRRIYAIPHEDQWLVRGSTAMAGPVLEWARHQLGFASFEELDAAVLTSPPGARGLLFLPYLAGERSPLWKPAARGAFLGLTLETGRADMARAVYEGLAFGMRHIVAVMAEHDVVPLQVRASGGLSRNAVLTQIKADILGLPISSAMPHELTTLGVASVAFGAVGAAVPRLVTWSPQIVPNDDRRRLYDRAFSSYRQHVDALMTTFERGTFLDE